MFEKIKKILKFGKNRDPREYKTSLVHPERDWLVIVVVLFLLFTAVTIFSYTILYRISTTNGSDAPTETDEGTADLNANGIQEVSRLLDIKNARFNELKNHAPTTTDPSL